MTAKETISNARGGVLLSHPFFATLALKHVLIEDKSIETMGTDSVSLVYNPEFVLRLSKKELIGVICHEMMHVALGHMFRIKGRDMKKWNVACDYAINGILLKQGIVLPPSVLRSDKYDDMSAEEIYNLLKDDDVKKALPMGEVTEYKQSSGNKQPDPASKKQGGPNGPESQPQGDYSSSPAVQEQKIKAQVQQAAMAGRLAGKLPGDLDRIVTDQLKTVVPWREVLARFITQTVFNDYSWTRPSKRYQHMGVYLPQLSVPDLSPVACIVDTSGSIDQHQINLLVSELQGIFYAFPETTVDVVYVDTKVCKHEEISAKDIKLHPKGGGGTDFRPGFSFINKMDKGHACILYFTDGYCNSFPQSSELPTLWIITPDGAPNFTPPFGEVINLKD